MFPLASFALALPRSPLSDRQRSIWGLHKPVELSATEGVHRIESTSHQDFVVAEGYLAAHLAMAAIDLERRLWSGRLAEMLGEKKLNPGLTAADLDPFVRLLGFRRQAEQDFRKLSPEQQADAESYARGVNAWIDSGAWRDRPVWKQLRSRPRLWAGTDCLLARFARHRVDTVGGARLNISNEARAAGWTEAWDHRVRRLWAALNDDALRSEGAVGAGYQFLLRPRDADSTRALLVAGGQPSSFPPFDNKPQPIPCIHPEHVIEGGDNHRVKEPDGGFRRLRVQRPDIEIRGSEAQRPWLRWSERGGLVSDLLQTPDSNQAKAGLAFAWCWNGPPRSEGESQSPGPGSPRTPLPSDHPWRLLPERPEARRSWRITLVPQGTRT